MKLGSSEEEFEKETGVNKKVFPYGMHKGKEFSEIPYEYLCYVYREHSLKGWLEEAVDDEISLRTLEESEEEDFNFPWDE